MFDFILSFVKPSLRDFYLYKIINQQMNTIDYILSFFRLSLWDSLFV